VVTVIYLKLNYIYDVTAVYEDRQRVCPTSDVKTAGRQKKKPRRLNFGFQVRIYVQSPVYVKPAEWVTEGFTGNT